MIDIRNLRHWLGTRCVLDIESLTLRNDAVNVIIGHNGAGKTTLLRIIAGLEACSTGSVVAGIPVTGRVFCSQKPYMFHGTVWDNLVKGLRFRRRPVDAAEVGQIASRLGLDPLLTRKAKRLSAGEMQRVALGRAMAVKPGLLLLDEPTANVDPDGVRAIEDEILRQHGKGVAVIVATHSHELAARRVANVLRLEEGRLTSAEMDNVFDAEVYHSGGDAFARLNGGVLVRCVSDRAGRLRIAIPANDVVVSLQRFDSSMANSLEGVIESVRSEKHRVELKLDAGIPLVAAITPVSLRRLAIGPGSNVVVSFKATSVRVL